eukprot:4267023-Ditylum_brightwellii.AAC.1
MIFHNAFKSITPQLKVLRPNNLSTEASSEGGSAGAGALLAAMSTTFGTCMITDSLSNFLQHPTQAMDYGYFNKFIGCE